MEDKKLIRRDKKDITDNNHKKKKIILFLSAVLVAILYVFLLTVEVGDKKELAAEEAAAAIEEQAIIEEQAALEEKAVNINTTPIEGGSINLSVSRFSTVNPLLNKEKSLDQSLKLIYDSLFEFDQNYNLVGELAKDYSFSGEGKMLTINLKTGISWHDGSQVTGKDIVYTINYLKSKPESPYYSLVTNIEAATSTTNNVILTLKEPNVLEVNNLIFPIITEKSMGNKATLSDDNFGVIGNGMYKPISYNQGRQFMLQKNENYYGDKPYIENITVKIFDDKEIRKNMFIASNIDIIDSNYYELSNYNYEIFNKVGYQSKSYEFIGFNTQKPPFDNQKNRAAVASILDMNVVLEDAYRGTVSYGMVPINSKSELYLASKNPYEFSEVRARRFSSFEQNDKILILTDKNDPMKHRLGYIIQSQLNLIGVASEVRAVEGSEIQGIIEAGNFNILISEYKPSPSMDISKILKTNPKLFNLPLAEINSLMTTLKATTNKESMHNIYKKIQDKTIYELPYIGIGFENEYVILHQKLNGNLESNSYEIYNGIENLYLPS